MQPSYIKLYETGELKERIQKLWAILKECTLCPRQCKVNRLEDERGFCKSGANPIISSYGPHYGEESPLVGRYGSGTIFMTHCNLKCIFCQNFDISHLGYGEEVSHQDFAQFMLNLQARGCHNINIVTPTHFTPQLVKALEIAIAGGLKIPIVYNCGGYESVETLELLDGIIDIYMPDAKYSNSEVARQLSNAPDYPEVMKAALKEMHQQVGDLIIQDGIAQHGLLVRHLVLPEGLAGTCPIMEFIAHELSTNTYVNIMAQYRPCGRAGEYPKLTRGIKRQEFEEAVKIAIQEGVTRLDERWFTRWL